MIRVNVCKPVIYGDRRVDYKEISGNSDDTKPTEGLATGSLFHEVDTTKVFAWDEHTQTWYEQCKLGGDE